MNWRIIILLRTLVLQILGLFLAAILSSFVVPTYQGSGYGGGMTYIPGEYESYSEFTPMSYGQLGVKGYTKDLDYIGDNSPESQFGSSFWENKDYYEYYFDGSDWYRTDGSDWWVWRTWLSWGIAGWDWYGRRPESIPVEKERAWQTYEEALAAPLDDSDDSIVNLIVFTSVLFLLTNIIKDYILMRKYKR